VQHVTSFGYGLVPSESSQGLVSVEEDNNRVADSGISAHCSASHQWLTWPRCGNWQCIKCWWKITHFPILSSINKWQPSAFGDILI